MGLSIADETVDWRTKGFWVPGAPQRAADFVAARHTLFGGAFTWPLLVLRRAAVAANIATMAAFCSRRGLSFAPHAKTTMAPTLLDAQLRAGAWGFTVATGNQALALRAFGAPRVLVANQVLDPSVLRWLAGQEDFEAYVQVDSVAGVRAIAAEVTGGRVLPVLVELGHPGGRAGCRTADDLAAVARAAVAAPGVALTGVTGYEGGLTTVADVAGYLDALTGAARRIAGDGLLPAEVVVSAGGSAWFDVVADRLAGDWLPGHRVRAVLRSGAYVSHDDGIYRDRTPFRRMVGEGGLDAALEVWAQVLSTPEPGLAIVGMGKRDVSFDEGLPVPMAVRRVDGGRLGAGGLTVTGLNDHHAFLQVASGAAVDPGDLVRFGISHPCTAFDKWRAIPVAEADDTVTDVLFTYF